MFSLSNHCTICSCGLGFTDPSAYTRHREASGHPKGATHGKVRLAIMKGVRIQYIDGIALTHDMIAADTFVPPLFDTSYHLRGKPKPRGKEKYNPADFTILVNAPPTLSAVQANGVSFTDGPPVVQYQVEPSVPARTGIKVDELGIDVDYSYDIELTKEPWNDQVANANAYTEWHTLPSSHSGIGPAQSPLPYNPHPCPPPGTTCDKNGVDSYDQSSVDFYDQNNISSFIPNNADLYRQQCRQSFSQAINSHPPVPSPPFMEPHVLPGYYPPQASHHALLSTPSPTYGMPGAHQQPFVGAMALGTRPPEPPQYTQLQLPPVYWPNLIPSAQAQHPTLVAPF